MSAYYNEFDAYPAQWLRNLSDAGHIAKGVVDERSIKDVRPEDLSGYKQCHFFAGIGGWSHALRLAGVADDTPVWTGSCPCQPFSTAGRRRGTADERHLWPEMFRLIRECRPAIFFGEQVAGRDGIAWLSDVLSDLESEGYAVGASVLCAAGVGAPHVRSRVYLVAYSGDAGVPRLQPSGGACEAGPWGRFGEADLQRLYESPTRPGRVWPRPVFRKVDDGVPARVGRLRAYGNAIVPQVAAEFIKAALG